MSAIIPNIQTYQNHGKQASPITSTGAHVIEGYNLNFLHPYSLHSRNHEIRATAHAFNLRCMSLRGGKRSGVQEHHSFIGGDGRTVANVNNAGEIVGSTVPWIDALIKEKKKVLDMIVHSIRVLSESFYLYGLRFVGATGEQEGTTRVPGKASAAGGAAKHHVAASAGCCFFHARFDIFREQLPRTITSGGFLPCPHTRPHILGIESSCHSAALRHASMPSSMTARECNRLRRFGADAQRLAQARGGWCEQSRAHRGSRSLPSPPRPPSYPTPFNPPH